MLRLDALVLSWLLLGGCGPNYKELKVDKIQRVDLAVADQNPKNGFCGYGPVALRAIVTYDDGKQASSLAPGEKQKHRLRISEFEWSASHGSLSKNAVLSLSEDALTWFDDTIEASARVTKRPAIGSRAVLRPHFDCGATLDLRGDVGSRGGEAENGGPGAPGPKLTVALGYLSSKQHGRLVLVRVTREDGLKLHYLVDSSSERPFVVDASGGDGGAGGQGIAGFSGRPGFSGEAGLAGVECDDGTAGQGGTDGEPGESGGPGARGGVGGPGGRVIVRFDARFPELSSKILIRVEGGGAGAPGPEGSGGLGGKGGRGGSGGKGGFIASSEAGPECKGADGEPGRNGVDGANGEPGPPGQIGAMGPPGDVQQLAAPVSDLFSEEIERGVPVFTEGGQ